MSLPNIGADKREMSPYAAPDDFFRVFSEDINAFYQLSFLLTGDHIKAERCLLAGLETCFGAKYIFKDWIHSWAKRTLIQNAICELGPRSSAARFFIPAVTALNPRNYLTETTETNAILSLDDFDRFVFIMSVLENLSLHECALLLTCSRQEIRLARNRAILRLVASECSTRSAEPRVDDMRATNL